MKTSWCGIVACMLWLLTASSGVSAEGEISRTPITTARVITRTLESVATVRGDLESPSSPTVAAEIPGRILRVSVDEGDPVTAGQVLAELDAEGHRIALERANANIQRLEALIQNHRLMLKRYKDLVAHQSSAQSELDKAKTDLDVSLAELLVAKARLREVRYQLSKTRILSPIKGVIQQRRVAAGDYVQEGDALFQVVATDHLQARLYFPETQAGRIRCDLPVQLETPNKGQKVETKITRLRPMLDPVNRALEALAEFDSQGDLKPGYSIIARVILDRRENAVLVPELSLVRRPAGTVVYRLAGEHVEERLVKTGMRDGDWIEILSGLDAGEIIALDGAGFLTDDAPIIVRNASQ